MALQQGNRNPRYTIKNAESSDLAPPTTSSQPEGLFQRLERHLGELIREGARKDASWAGHSAISG